MLLFVLVMMVLWKQDAMREWDEGGYAMLGHPPSMALSLMEAKARTQEKQTLIPSLPSVGHSQRQTISSHERKNTHIYFEKQ